jgi:hypothetical protein
LWSLSVIFQPIYVFPSGLPQPADALMAVLILALLTGYFVRAPLRRDLYLSGSMFVGWAAVVNWFWWTQYDDIRFLLSPLYYLFNFALVIVILSLRQSFPAKFVNATKMALTASIVIELAALIAVPGDGLREVGTFNNPNQLGYWSLLTTACWLVIKGKDKLTIFDLLIMGGLTVVAMFGLSKAAMVSLLFLLVCGLWFQGATRACKVILVLVGLVASTWVLATDSGQNWLSVGFGGRVLDRFEDIGKQRDDTASGRGYDRIWLYPKHLILGAGEGAYERFPPSLPNEMHSTFGTLVFAYGLPGSVFFLILLWLIFRRAPLHHFLYFLAIAMYGLTHQGLRFSFFWVFLALVVDASPKRINRSGTADLGGRRVTPAAMNPN